LPPIDGGDELVLQAGQVPANTPNPNEDTNINDQQN
jgi:hypothetical protein